MSFLELVAIGISCVLFSQSPAPGCVQDTVMGQPAIASAQTVTAPYFSGQGVDVELTAESALAWDLETGEILYDKNSTERRPIASVSKLLSALYVRSIMPTSTVVEIPEEVLGAQRKGVDVQLTVGEHASVQDLLAAALIPSANDAMVSLAVAASGSEEVFVEEANTYAVSLGAQNTRLANSTGLEGGEQYSTAADVQIFLSEAFADPILRTYLSEGAGVIETQEGSRRTYETTNELLGSYLPVHAAKTGYTIQAGQNLTMISENDEGDLIGLVVLGSDQRFQDMKVLIEWINRNYTWP